MRIAICDDEIEVREILAEKVRRLCPEAEVFLYAAGAEILSTKAAPDILFLDIQMPGLDGMETAKELRKKNRRLILIFVTALEEYVFQAFDVGAFHYLVKPFSEEKFASVFRSAVAEYEEERRRAKLLKRAEMKGEGSFYGMSEEKGNSYGMSGGGQEERCIMIQSRGSHVKIRLGDIVYAEVFNRKVVIHKMAEDIEYYGKLSELEKLSGEDFFRPHRAFLVNLRYVVKYDAMQITLEKGYVPIAKKNYPAFVKSYLKYNQRTGSGRKV